MKKLTALIPAHNDDYMLWFCLRSIAEHFAEILVFNDGSIDNTREVVEKVRVNHPHIQYLEHCGDPLGWAGARQQLIQKAQGEHLFFIDADEVLCEDNSHWLQKIPDMAAVVYHRFTDIWGDFNHTTQRLEHTDPCHLYVNRTKVYKLDWYIDDYYNTDFPELDAPDKATTPGILFWHARGVKPDWRLLQRSQFNQWHAVGREGTPYDFLMDMPEESIHEHAIKRLLTDPEHHIQRWKGKPEKPSILAQAETRFEMVYRSGKIVDRHDHGWGGARCFHFTQDDSDTAWDNYFPRQVDGVSLKTSGDVFTFLMEESGKIAACNHPQAFLWSLCNKGRTIGDIKQIIRTQFNDEAACDVMPGLRNLARAGCVEIKRW